ASGKLGKIPAELVAQRVLVATPGGDWPVQRAALEALLRRRTFARRDGLKVARRPRHATGFGVYETRHAKGKRPYRTLLASVDPIVGSCDCPDFHAGGLGLCKHLLVVLETLRERPLKWKRALKAGPSWVEKDPRLVWDPVRPLTGFASWIDRLAWQQGTSGELRFSAWPAIVRNSFKEKEPGLWGLKETWPEDIDRRLELVDGLRRLLRRRVSAEVKPSCLPDDPAIMPLLEQERARLRRAREGAAHGRTFHQALTSFRGTLYPYQEEGVQRFLAKGRLLLADDMGLGKTIQAIAACNVLWTRGAVKRGLLLVPAPLKSQWEREWNRFSDVPIAPVEGSPTQREAIYRQHRRGFLIANYEQVLRDLHLMRAWAPDMVVLDEAQRIKNWATKTAAYVKKLDPPYRLVLTGTPMENRLAELASIMDWVDPEALEPKWRLEPWHATLVDGTQEVAGARNLDTLRARLAPSLMRRLRKEVLDQLPPRTDTRVPVAMDPAQLSEHNALRVPIASLMQRAKKRPLMQAEFLRLMQLLTTQRIICNGLAQLNFSTVWPDLHNTRPSATTLAGLSAPKLLELRELVQELVIEGGQKMVIFSQWRRMLQLSAWALSDLLAPAGLRAGFFSGDESQRRRTHNIVDFHDDPTLAVLLSTDAGGVGLNLQRAASCLVNLELPWNPAVLEQRVGRIYRLGQKNPVQVYHLVSEGGIEARIAQLVSNKQALFSGLFDGESNEIRFGEGGGRFLDRVEKLVEPLAVTDELAPTTPASPESEDMDPLGSAPDLDAQDLDAQDLDAQDLDAQDLDARDEKSTLDAGAPKASSLPPQHASQEQATEAHPSGARGQVDASPHINPKASPSNGAAIHGMLAAIEVHHTETGGLRIEAPKEAASTLAAIFQGMADLLARASSPPPRN
ncbi:MAG: DEAD/DEAH box helicase, partial [Deltaproteobacteria bacterium]|nr:DEAD/DEAH box helicase [Deltaproteobacteria bacterium]